MNFWPFYARRSLFCSTFGDHKRLMGVLTPKGLRKPPNLSTKIYPKGPIAIEEDPNEVCLAHFRTN